ncbi:zf-HC2 domain-containing protein [Spiractinospora alimapuensis]|uniref:zf-HC2 domain-containing protein n=1 Tax=Spiractinospora alimapuensis TaxID=2820884 RepID=UPI001F3F5091|nr:zf-HC2 domain-containing protein [Spiractinospora alimapuensis]QVQ54553.1 zf-HC2 domain-containing protein [Spiractinospora alimapuensis]
MTHLDEEALTRAGAHADARLSGAEREHLASCAHCRAQVDGTAQLAAALRAEATPPAVPSFDALVAPHLTPRSAEAPVPAPTISAGRALRLAGAVALRQARLVPRALWWGTAGGFAALALALLVAPGVAGEYLVPAIIAIVTIAGVAVNDPRRDPRQEALYTMLVPPVAVWLSRLALVLGAVLGLGLAVSALAAAFPGAGQPVASLIGAWMTPALLGVSLTVFGAVWRSPAVGLVFGAASWALAVASIHGALASTRLGTVATLLWGSHALVLVLATVALGAAARLVARPARALG